ncbi:MAG: glycoside hydrolase family 71/99-like protein [Bacteroidota bacterium]
MREQFNIIQILLFATLILFSCQEEEFLTGTEQSDTYIGIDKFPAKSDTTYSDDLLRQILDEETQYLKNPELHRLVDVSGMDVNKENPKKIYAHYMPWFQSKDYDGYWGQHWTMTNRNPDLIDESGRRQIASFYYPLIGPYSSKDPDLHEYHFLMMKLAGIDGVIFDWYGSRDLYDYGLIKESTESFIDILEELGMDFSIMYEDRVATMAVANNLAVDAVTAAQEDFQYINDQYFSSPNYLKYNGNNLMYVFGPHHIITEQEWSEVFEVLPANEQPDFLTLWAASDRVGPNSTGEFLWVAPDHLEAHKYYYQTYPQFNAITVGGVYPGFESYYSTGGWSEGVNDWVIDHEEGETFVETLNYSSHEVSDFLQLITWNDFGEGTMIEPTEEYGFMYLQLLQQYSGVEYAAEDLYIPLELYETRKKYADNSWIQRVLDRTYEYIKQERFGRVKAILTAVNRFY